jgi:hypothetical protein
MALESNGHSVESDGNGVVEWYDMAFRRPTAQRQFD